MARRGDGSVNGGPYRSMKQDAIKIPRRSYEPYFWYVCIGLTALCIGAALDNQLAKTHTVYSTKEVQKIVNVEAPPPKCVEKASLLSDGAWGSSWIHCDNADHIIHKDGNLITCACKRKD